MCRQRKLHKLIKQAHAKKSLQASLVELNSTGSMREFISGVWLIRIMIKWLTVVATDTTQAMAKAQRARAERNREIKRREEDEDAHADEMRRQYMLGRQSKY